MSTLDEMFAQAIQLLQQGDDADGRQIFQQILAQDDGHFGANYLMACESVHAGDTDQARLHFQKALYRQPEHPICRFQAGLLELTSANLGVCAQVWAPLEQHLPDDHYIKLFVQGCLAMAMAMDQFEQAENLLLRGIQQNRENPALNRDMGMLIEEIRQRDRAPEATATTAESAAATDENTAQAGSTLAALQLFQQSKLRH